MAQAVRIIKSSKPKRALRPNQDMTKPVTSGNNDYPIDPPRAYFDVFLVFVIMPRLFGRFIIKGYWAEQNSPMSPEPIYRMLCYWPVLVKYMQLLMAHSTPERSNIICFQLDRM